MVKEYLICFIENALHRLKNDECTPEEINSAARIIKDNICTYTTIDDVAEKFNKPKRSIHDAINRNRWGEKLRPKRVHLYKFSEIINILPKKWF